MTEVLGQHHEDGMRTFHAGGREVRGEAPPQQCRREEEGSVRGVGVGREW